MSLRLLIDEDSQAKPLVSTSTAKAKTDCKIAILDQEHFLFDVQETSLFALEVMRSYSDLFRSFKLMI